MKLNYIVVFIMLLVITIYLLCYQYKENFDFIKRRYNGLDILNSGTDNGILVKNSVDGLSSGISPPWTTSPVLKNKVKYYCEKIIEEINNKTSENYKFSKFDYIKEEDSCKGNKYLVELFIHNKNKKNYNSETKKLIINFTILPCNKLMINTLNISNAMKYNFIDENNDNFFFKPNINKDQDKPLILTDENLLENEKTNGTYDTSLEFSKHKGCTSDTRIPSLFRNWILPLGTEEQHWQKMQGKCMNVPFSPNPVMSSIDGNNYSWLFGVNRGNPNTGKF